MNHEKYVNFSFSLSIFCLLALIPYTINTFNLLRPTTIIDKLSTSITGDNIQNRGIQSTIQPIKDIIYNSLANHNSQTATYGINVIETKIITAFEKEGFTTESKRRIFFGLCRTFSKVSKLAISNDDEISTTKLITSIGNISMTLGGDIVGPGITFLEEIGKEAIENRFDAASIYTVKYLADIWKVGVERELTIISLYAANAFGNIVDIIIKEEIWYQLALSIKFLEEITRTAIAKKDGWHASVAIVLIEKIITTIAEKAPNLLDLDPFPKTIEFFEEIKEKSENQGLSNDTISRINSAIKNVGNAINK